MWSFEVHYVVVAQKISWLEGAKYEKNHHTSTPPIHTFLKLNQHNVSLWFLVLVLGVDAFHRKESGYP